MKTLYMVFHPNLEHSKVNKIWYEQVAESSAVTTVRDIGSEYPDFNYNIEKEHKLLLDHDRIIFQFPFYWYNMPWQLKKYFDEIFSFNFAYGPEGDKLKNKEFQVISSVGGAVDSYTPGGYQNFTASEFYRPLQQTAFLSRMKYLPPYFMYSAVAADEIEIKQYGEKIISLIEDIDRADSRSVLKRILKRAKDLK